MEPHSYYHLCADGRDAQNFIISKKDFLVAFNYVGICAASCPDVKVLAFAIEDTHPHFLLYGDYGLCLKFKQIYEDCYRKYVAHSRNNLDDMRLKIQLYAIDNPEYLRNVGTYIINQPTKDGKHVMPYDYLYGTGSMYFRNPNSTPLWCYDDEGRYVAPYEIKNLSARQRMDSLHTRRNIPENWQMANGFLLPHNYVDISRYESIYVTANCFRVFLASNKSHDAEIIKRMVEARGVAMEDIEARCLCADLSIKMFRTSAIRSLNSEQRVALALELRRRYRLSIRQIATLSRLPQSEIERFIQ